jgi:mycoredoxin
MEVIVYCSPWCPDCREAKRFLARHNIIYREIDIDKVPGTAEEIVERTGKRAIPQFVINGTWVQPYRPGEGFLYEEMGWRSASRTAKFRRSFRTSAFSRSIFR